MDTIYTIIRKLFFLERVISNLKSINLIYITFAGMMIVLTVYKDANNKPFKIVDPAWSSKTFILFLISLNITFLSQRVHLEIYNVSVFAVLQDRALISCLTLNLYYSKIIQIKINKIIRAE